MLPKEKPNFQEMDVLELFKTKSALDDLKNKTTDYLNEVKDILKSRYNNRAKSELQLKGQDFGTVTIADNNCKVKVFIKIYQIIRKMKLIILELLKNLTQQLQK